MSSHEKPINPKYDYLKYDYPEPETATARIIVRGALQGFEGIRHRIRCALHAATQVSAPE